MNRLVLLTCLFIAFNLLSKAQQIERPKTDFIPEPQLNPPVEKSQSQFIQADKTLGITEPSTWKVMGEGAHFHSLQAAINDPIVKSGDIIHLQGVLRYDGQPITGIVINKNLEIIGTPEGVAVIDATPYLGAATDRRCITVNSGTTVILRNITLREGVLAEYNGAGIYNDGYLTMSNVRIYSCKTSQAGGAVCNAGMLTCEDCIFDSNQAVWGGAFYTFGNWAHTTLMNCRFNHNTATWGGALYNYQSSTMNISGSNFLINTSTNHGGAIYNYGSILIKDSNIYQNKSDDGPGGAIFNVKGCTLNIEDSRLYENEAETTGGAISNSGTIRVNRSAFYDNVAKQYQGGAIANFGYANLKRVTVSGNKGYSAGLSSVSDSITILDNAHMDLICCTITDNEDSKSAGVGLHQFTGTSRLNVQTSIIAKNRGGGVDVLSGNGQFYSLGLNIIGTSDTTYTLFDGDMQGIDPLLEPRTNIAGVIECHPLKASSPALDAIPSSRSIANDDNYTQVGLWDIGAYESPLVSFPTANWSDFKAYNRVPQVRNNVVIVNSTSTIWDADVNNLHIGENAIFEVKSPITVHGAFYNNGDGKNLIIYEGGQFNSNVWQIAPPTVYSVETRKINQTTIEVTLKMNPNNQLDSIEFEFGPDVFTLKRIKTMLYVGGGSDRTEVFQITDPDILGGYCRLRFVNQRFQYVTSMYYINTTGVENLLTDDVFSILRDSENNGWVVEAKSTTNEVLKVSIYNALGQLIGRYEQTEKRQQIPFYFENTGIYLVNIETDKHRIVKKIAAM